MKSVISWAIKNSPAMNTLLIASLIVGAVSLVIMRREVFPEFELEIILVSVVYPGATPEETEEGVCEKLEAAIKGVNGVRKITSVAREGAGFCVVELNSSVRDVQKVLNEIRSEIDQIPSFPELAEDPHVQQIVFRAPAVNIGILGPADSPQDPLVQELQLRSLAEEIRDDLHQLPPVKPSDPIRAIFAPLIASPTQPAISTAEIIAAREFQIDVLISEDTLRHHGLSLQQVGQIIRQQNIEMPGGKMETDSQEVLLRGQNRHELGQEIADITVIAEPNGDIIRVRDLGEVRDGFADTTSEHRINGHPAMVITVLRTSDEDLMTVVETVRQYISQKKLPEGYRVEVWNDISIDVQERMDLLTKNGLQGLVLVFIVLAVFLDLRLAFWVALGIPVSILGAGFVLLITGQTLNMLTMFSFLMALGIVVDDAIVIGENVYSKRQEGMNYVRAAIEGTYEVLPSVCASVTTTIFAFLPLMFVTGVMGKFIAVMPLAVIAMLIISLIESMFVLPCHLAHDKNLFMRMLGSALYIFRFLLVPFRWINQRADVAMNWVVDRVYFPLMKWALHHKSIVLSAAMAALLLAAGFIAAGITPVEAFPKLDSRLVSATVVFPDGTSTRFAREATQLLEEKFRDVEAQIRKETGKGVSQLVYRKVGEVGDAFRGGPMGVTNGTHVGSVEISLVTTADRNVNSEEIIRRWRNAVPRIAGADIVRFGSAGMGPGGQQIEFKLLASDSGAAYLEQAAEECKAYLAERKGVFDIEDDMRLGKWEMKIDVNEQGRALGLTREALGRTIRTTYFGEEVTRLQRGRHEVKLMVRYPDADRGTMAGFEEIRIRDSSGVERPITEVSEITFGRANSEINRLNQKRTITITADVNKEEGGNAFNIIREMQQGFIPDLLARYETEYGAKLYVNWEGQQQQTTESLSSLFVGFFIALICMFVLLTLEFRSYMQPAIIMMIIPFGMIGAVLGHAVMGLELTLFSFFGLIALTGVVVNDSIVLVDFINHRVRDGMPLNDALVEAGRRRFRPIMLTSVTTIAALTPMLMERSFQAQVLIPMAASLVFGLLASTILIPVLVPVMYQLYGKMVGVDRTDDDSDLQNPAQAHAPLPPAVQIPGAVELETVQVSRAAGRPALGEAGGN